MPSTGSFHSVNCWTQFNETRSRIHAVFDISGVVDHLDARVR